MLSKNVLQFYVRDEKLKCVAQPYEVKALRKVVLKKETTPSSRDGLKISFERFAIGGVAPKNPRDNTRRQQRARNTAIVYEQRTIEDFLEAPVWASLRKLVLNGAGWWWWVVVVVVVLHDLQKSGSGRSQRMFQRKRKYQRDVSD